MKQDKIQVLKNISDQLKEVHQEMEKPKVDLFKALFPDVEDPTDWEILVPENVQLPAGTPPWIKNARYVETIIAWNPKTAYSDLN